jgi:hypothetical protein
MALRVYGGNQVQRAGGYLQSASAQRIFHTFGVAANSRESTWPSAMSSIARLLRPNNDGPGWTRNRTATPELVRPVQFKEAAPGPPIGAHTRRTLQFEASQMW